MLAIDPVKSCADKKPKSVRAQTRRSDLSYRCDAALLVFELYRIKIGQTGETVAAAIGSAKFEKLSFPRYRSD